MFLNDEAEEAFRQPSFIPSIHLSLKTERFIPSDTKFPYDINGKEMIIMIGAPASGKSYVSQDLANKYGYSIINQDTLVTKNACQKMAQKLMDEGKNIIIDNTNRDPKTRWFLDIIFN
jgi:bifunctional polynucleotide phosphatase/kinase